jgi:hypothetical protein
MDRDMATPAQRDLQRGPILARPPVVDDQTLLRQAELTATVAVEYGFAMAPEALGGVPVTVITRPAPTVRIEVRLSASAAPPSRLHIK